MTHIAKNPLQQFHHKALEYKLSAGAILLWQHIYFMAQAQGKYQNLRIRTAELMTVLSLTRNGLQKIRHSLINAGLLQVRIDAQQNVWYTLMINGETLHINNHHENHVERDAHIPIQNTSNKKGRNTSGSMKASTPTKCTSKPDDILQNNAYRKLLDAFCTQHDSANATCLNTRLQQFLYRRKQQGKTLTQAGLDALLNKLADLAQSNVRTMVNIIDQSISRGWYGFYPYKPCNGTVYSRTSGGCPSQSRAIKYDTKKEDLDFLEW